MGEFFKKLFDFNNVKKLFTYNWSDVFSHIVPKSGHKITVTDDEYTNVQNGAILMASGSVISAVLITIISTLIAGGLPFGGLFVGVFIGAILGALIGALIVPGFIFIYNMVTRKNEKGTVVYFIIWILGLLSALGMVISLINLIGDLVVAPIFAIIGIAFLFLQFMGIVHVLVGTIDICTRANKGKTSEGKVEDATYKNVPPKFCPKCGAPVEGGKFCSKCGNKFE